MKKLLLAVFSLVSIIANAQTAEEIVNNYTKAMGGLEIYQKAGTARMTGVVTAQGMDFPITILIVNTKSMRADIDVMGQKIVNVYNEGKGWKIDPFNGANEATDVEGAELVGFRSQATIASTLMNYRALENKIEAAGDEMIDGVKHYKVKMTSKDDGKASTYYINGTTWYITKVVSTREIQGQETDIETLFTDLKEFGGLKFYMTRSQQAMGQVFQTISFTNVEMNVAVDPKIFDK
jgi:hypothetical protein